MRWRAAEPGDQLRLGDVGNRISQTDSNQHTTTYGYDNLGRRTSRKLPAGQSESYTYDLAGNLKTKVDFNGKTTTYAYDTNNRLLSKTPTEVTSRLFSGDGVGDSQDASSEG